jgi:hypothetical protein
MAEQIIIFTQLLAVIRREFDDYRARLRRETVA